MKLSILLKKIADEGKRLLESTLPEESRKCPHDREDDGVFITPWLFQSFLPSHPRWRPFVYLILLPLIILEPVLAVARPFVYPLFALAWRLEIWLARRLGRSFCCLWCHNPMKDPYFHCPACNDVSPILRPRLSSFFFRTCACGESVWFIWGQHFRRDYTNLICRDTTTYAGCYRPHYLPRMGAKRVQHCAVAGTSVRAKHVVLSYLLNYLKEHGPSGRGGYAPAGELSELELELSRMFLARAYSLNTRIAERPHAKYSLARSFVLESANGKHFVAIHNIPCDLFAQTRRLADFGLEWHSISCLILVVDEPHLTTKMPASECFSRLFRVMEEYLPLAPGNTLPTKLAVVVPLPPDSAGSHVAIADEDGEGLPAHWDENLSRLAQRMYPAGWVRFFGGSLPKDFERDFTSWIEELALWAFSK